MCRFGTPFVVKEITNGMLSNRPEIVSDCAGLMDWIPIQLNDETRAAFERLVELTRHENDKLRNRAVRSLRGKAPSLLASEFDRDVKMTTPIGWTSPHERHAVDVTGAACDSTLRRTGEFHRSRFVLPVTGADVPELHPLASAGRASRRQSARLEKYWRIMKLRLKKGLDVLCSLHYKNAGIFDSLSH